MGDREYRALKLLGLIAILLILENTIIISLLGSSLYLYYVKPLIWLSLSYIVWRRPRTRFKGKLKLHKFILLWSAICGVLYTSVYFAGGFLDGIGQSPYSKGLFGRLVNIVCFGGVALMMEWVRGYIVNVVKGKYKFLFGSITVLLFTLYRLNLRLLMGAAGLQQVVEYLGEFMLPEIMENILLTYLVYIGGAYPAIIYKAIVSIPIWLAPILPDLVWITKAFIGIIMPVIFIIILRQVYRKESRDLKLREQKAEKPHVWITTGIISVLIIWFAVGVFPIFPTVILTGSMEPSLYPGDIAIMRKVKPENIKDGDVIQYFRRNIFIIHRVIDIDEDGEFQTKGDNNSAPDSELVGVGQVRGKMIGTVPKLGMLRLILTRRSQPTDEPVEF